MINTLPTLPAFTGELWFLLVILTIVVWTVAWKGFALWTAARTSDIWWFVALLLVNTIGILEIVYLYLVLPRRKRETADDVNDSM